MAFPVAADELALHERVLAGDPVAPVDVYQGFMDAIADALRGDLRCSQDEAHDSGVDAILSYLEDPARYDRGRGRLSSYLMDIAKKRAIDRIRSRGASARRDERYAAVVELRAPNPKEVMEAEVEAKELWCKVEESVEGERDREAIKLILAGERSTDALAAALGLAHLSALEKQRQVKQHRDRLLKALERLGRRLVHDQDT